MIGVLYEGPSFTHIKLTLVDVSAVAPADLIAPSPHSYHMYYAPSPTYSNFRFIKGQELIEIHLS